MKLETTAMAIPALDNPLAERNQADSGSRRQRLLSEQNLDSGQGLRVRVPAPFGNPQARAGTECSSHRCRAVQGSSGADYDSTGKCDPRGDCTERSGASGL